MKKARLTAKSRSSLDKRFQQWGPPDQYLAPNRGWIKAIRNALGMTTAQLAARIGIKQPSMVALEQSEERGTIELATLRRVAEALDCRLIYALVPNQPLDAIVRDRARAFIGKRLQPVEHSMLLEDQKVNNRQAINLEDLIRETKPSLFWDEPL